MRDVISRVLSVMLLMSMAVPFASCGDDENTDVGTYFLSSEGKVAINVVKDQACVSFYSKDEAALRSELIKYGLTLGNVEPYRYTEEDCTAAGWALMESLMRGTVTGGDYEKAESAHQYIVGGFPCCRLVEDDCLLTPQILIYVKIGKGVEIGELKSLAERNGMVLVSENPEGIYVFACTRESKRNIVEMSNMLFTSGLVEWSEIMGFGHGHLC